MRRTTGEGVCVVAKQMAAGYKLDRLVGERVLGCRIRRQRKLHHGSPLYYLVIPGSTGVGYRVSDPEIAWASMPRVSTDYDAMHWLIGRMQQKGWVFTIISTLKNDWYCMLSHRETGRGTCERAAKMPHAVALAVLRTVD